jgi:hypothetical protein
LSRDLQLNCVISFFFRLYLVLHACAARFDVTGTVALFGFAFWVGDPTKQARNGPSGVGGGKWEKKRGELGIHS